MTQKLDRNKELEFLLELYKIAIEEYRFQVNFNTETSKFYLLLNSGLISATCGLLRFSNLQYTEFLTISLFVLGLFIALLGCQTLLKGEEYRRETTYKKGQLENELAKYIDIIPIETTVGMKEARSSTYDTFVNRPLRIGSIGYFAGIVFVLFMIINGSALIYLGAKFAINF